MEWMSLLLLAALGFVAVLFLLRSKQNQYKGHVQQLQTAAKPATQRTIGNWTREEIAKHRTADDLWLIIQVGNEPL